MQTAVEERGGDLAFASSVGVAAVEGARDYDVAHRSDRLIAILPAPRAGAPRAALIADWAQ
jgi:hypothetical protein